MKIRLKREDKNEKSKHSKQQHYYNLHVAFWLTG
jgi:hypothetical protein